MAMESTSELFRDTLINRVVARFTGDIERINGVGGQVAYAVSVAYALPGDPAPDAGDFTKVTFVGSVYGSPGPIMMITDSGLQARVDDPDRYGPEFNRSWVRAFFA